MISGEQRDSEGGIWGMGVGHGTWDVGMVLFFPFVRRVERRQGDLVFFSVRGVYTSRKGLVEPSRQEMMSAKLSSLR